MRGHCIPTGVLSRESPMTPRIEKDKKWKKVEFAFVRGYYSNIRLVAGKHSSHLFMLFIAAFFMDMALSWDRYVLYLLSFFLSMVYEITFWSWGIALRGSTVLGQLQRINPNWPAWSVFHPFGSDDGSGRAGSRVVHPTPPTHFFFFILSRPLKDLFHS